MRLRGLKEFVLDLLEPGIITEEFTEGIAKLPKMCPHFPPVSAEWL